LLKLGLRYLPLPPRGVFGDLLDQQVAFVVPSVQAAVETLLDDDLAFWQAVQVILLCFLVIPAIYAICTVVRYDSGNLDAENGNQINAVYRLMAIDVSHRLNGELGVVRGK
jgi:hypothetical protein